MSFSRSNQRDNENYHFYLFIFEIIIINDFQFIEDSGFLCEILYFYFLFCLKRKYNITLKIFECQSLNLLNTQWQLESIKTFRIIIIDNIQMKIKRIIRCNKIFKNYYSNQRASRLIIPISFVFMKS